MVVSLFELISHKNELTYHNCVMVERKPLEIQFVSLILTKKKKKINKLQLQDHKA